MNNSSNNSSSGKNNNSNKENSIKEKIMPPIDEHIYVSERKASTDVISTASVTRLPDLEKWINNLDKNKNRKITINGKELKESSIGFSKEGEYYLKAIMSSTLQNITIEVAKLNKGDKIKIESEGCLTSEYVFDPDATEETPYSHGQYKKNLTRIDKYKDLKADYEVELEAFAKKHSYNIDKGSKVKLKTVTVEDKAKYEEAKAEFEKLSDNARRRGKDEIKKIDRVGK